MKFEIYWDDLNERAQEDLMDAGFNPGEYNQNLIPFVEIEREPEERKTYKVGVHEVYEQMYEVEAFSKEEALELIKTGEGFIDDQMEFIGIEALSTPVFYKETGSKIGWVKPE